jgi:hemerythrin-like domain-containing protein
MMKTRLKEVHPEESVTGSAQGKGKALLFDLLRQDHEKIRDLLKKIEKSTSTQVEIRKEFFTTLEQELLIHMEAEERFFYTALEQHDESRARALISYEEHQVVRTIIGAFNGLAVDDERWPAKLKVLSQQIRQHADEEEHELFKMAKKVLDNDQFQGIVAKVLELKRESKNA